MGRQLRITGLVRAADVVRRELSGPLSPERLDRLRQSVRTNLQQVQQILAAHRASLQSLPAPSQRAYEFLASLDLSKVAQRPPVVGAPAQPTLSWRGLTRFIDQAMQRLASDLAPAELRSLGDAISRTSRQIELTLSRRQITPDRLAPKTRLQRGWLKFFSLAENLTLYADARATASRILDAAGADSQHYPPPLVIHFRPMTGIYKLRATRGRPILWLPTPMIAFDLNAFADLSRLIFGREGHARRRVIEEMTGDGYQAIRAEMEALGGVVENSHGAVHDLASSFDRVNAAYFSGTMPRPRLTWNRTFTGRKFGHYDWILDTVMVSRTLDAPQVPEFVVDFLVFHELLHKYHGLHWVNGRGYAHTTEFLADERKFAQYEQAEAVLSSLARGIP